MNRGQQLSLIAFLALLIGIYLFGQTKDPAQPARNATVESVPPEEREFDIEAYVSASIDQLTGEKRQEAIYLDSLRNSKPSNAKLTALLDSLIGIMSEPESRALLPVAYFKEQKAQMLNTFEQWNNAGDAYALMQNFGGLNPSVADYVSGRSIYSYERALEFLPDDKDTKVKLASVYLEGDNTVMNGVQILLGIVREEPQHPEANLLLGRYGIISGQFEKAIGRLENVVSSQPENAEALFLLAEAYNGSGNSEKAVALFERCKELVANEAFRKEIDQYIENIKNR